MFLEVYQHSYKFHGTLKEVTEIRFSASLWGNSKTVIQCPKVPISANTGIEVPRVSEKKNNEKERNESKQKETDEETRLLKERKIKE